MGGDAGGGQLLRRTAAGSRCQCARWPHPPHSSAPPAYAHTHCTNLAHTLQPHPAGRPGDVYRDCGGAPPLPAQAAAGGGGRNAAGGQPGAAVFLRSLSSWCFPAPCPCLQVLQCLARVMPACTPYPCCSPSPPPTTTATTTTPTHIPSPPVSPCSPACPADCRVGPGGGRGAHPGCRVPGHTVRGAGEGARHDAQAAPGGWGWVGREVWGAVRA